MYVQCKRKLYRENKTFESSLTCEQQNCCYKRQMEMKRKNNKINNISIKCNEFYHKFCLLALLFSCHLPVKQIYNSSICCVTIPKIHLLFSILPSCHPQLLTHFIPCKIHSYHITYIHIYNIHTYIRTQIEVLFSF